MKIFEIGEFKLELNRDVQKEFIKQNETKLMKHIFISINARQLSKLQAINELSDYLKNVCDMYISFDLLDKMCSECGANNDNS